MTDDTKNNVVDMGEKRAERAFSKEVEDNAIHIYHLLEDVCSGLIEKYGDAEVVLATNMVAKHMVDGLDEKKMETFAAIEVKIGEREIVTILKGETNE